MLIVVDFNVVFSALIGKGKSLEVFEANKIFDIFEFIAPEYIFSEFDRKFGKLLSQTKLTREELTEAFSFIKRNIKIIPSSEFLDKLPEAMELNLKDSPYLALALKLNCPILSGDKGLKEQTKVRILSPSEVLTRIYGQE